MAKVQQKSEKISAFGGIFFVLDKFDCNSVPPCYLKTTTKSDDNQNKQKRGGHTVTSTFFLLPN